MTYKKAYLFIFIYVLIAVICNSVFENPKLLSFLLIVGLVLFTLLKGYAKDNEKQQGGDSD